LLVSHRNAWFGIYVATTGHPPIAPLAKAKSVTLDQKVDEAVIGFSRKEYLGCLDIIRKLFVLVAAHHA
jgi:hypothetical protein